MEPNICDFVHSLLLYMATISNAHDRNVIDDILLNQSIVLHTPSAFRSIEEEIDYSTVSNLRMDFKNILIIENLENFCNLTRLELCNNNIHSIGGLQSLVNLKWLDLSFNEIHRMEGLDSLSKLEDLSLTSNKIQVIENIESLFSLQILTLASNRITNLENINSLRGLYKLRALRLNGNPISGDVSYQNYIVSRLPQLVYIDFKLISLDDRLNANNRFYDDIQTLDAISIENEHIRIEAHDQNIQKALEISAFIDSLNSTEFYNHLVSEDLQCFVLFPGMSDISECFHENILLISKQCASYGLEAQKRRESDAREFFECIEMLIEKSKHVCLEIIENFKKNYCQNELQISKLQDELLINSILSEMRCELKDMFNLLVANEMQLVEQIDVIFQEFERNINEDKLLFLEKIRTYMTQCREFSQEYTEKLSDIAMNTLETFSKGQIETDLPDEVLRLLIDKDNLLATLSASHDCHMTTIDKNEDYINVSINNYVYNLILNFSLSETKRNRLKIAELQNFFDSIVNSIDDLEENLRTE